MSLSTRIAPHLPYLRRFARAVSGSQTSGDAYVAATLEAIIADVSIFPEASSDRIALYKLFSQLVGSVKLNEKPVTSPFGWEPADQALNRPCPTRFRIASARIDRAELPVQRKRTLKGLSDMAVPSNRM